MSAMNESNSLDAVKEFLIRYGVRLEDLEEWRCDIDNEFVDIEARLSSVEKNERFSVVNCSILFVAVVILALRLLMG